MGGKNQLAREDENYPKERGGAKVHHSGKKKKVARFCPKRSAGNWPEIGTGRSAEICSKKM